MNLPMEIIKNYNHFNKTESQTYTSITNGIVGNYVSATLITALVVVGLFPRMSFKKNSKDSHHDSKGLEGTLDEIQTQLNKSLQQWGNNNDQPDDYSKSNTSMRP
jgi:hypothetical protein